MKKGFFIVMIITILGFICPSIAEDKVTITVNQFVSHVALDAAYNGLVKSLEERDILPNKVKIIMANAQGNIGNSAQIAKHQASAKPEFMVAIATPSAQTLMKAKTDTSTLAFLAVSDPEAINLTNRADIIGVADNPPIEELIEKITQIFPDIKNIGVIFNYGEINSIKTVERLEKVLKDRNIILKKIAITNSNDIKNAFNKLIGEVNLIYIPQDNTVVSALASMVSMSKANKIPLIANDPTLVDQGVMMALGTNYFRSGEQLGNMIADLIEGKKLEKNIQNTNIKELKINDEVVREFGIVIPENIKRGEN
ncbi:ABC transporter substrate binding protein [Candidatus Megaera venefica]|jgi:putative ABC transport system substrate-binding protein|uniref:ABC transporter substrate binding protein n=1 Tax=Candidatus Megaera venefica TaxID=2055910 RepID=A0ABU5NC73_9RICK|nr:ABC transporter substrate-binding protein [Candidatus Megaera venefica]MEA0970731.1 ABC transporter substrate binding protein [Candidatus Megaera venefica]